MVLVKESREVMVVVPAFHRDEQLLPFAHDFVPDIWLDGFNVLGAETPKRLEDLYLPYKPKKRSLATAARERGLEPLALAIWNRDPALSGSRRVCRVATCTLRAAASTHEATCR